jgi:5'-phosphate synthase pdxT subunit
VTWAAGTAPQEEGAVIGVLALQGAFSAHVEVLRRIGVDTLLVRSSEELDRVDALVLPGGESTTMSNLLARHDLGDRLRERLRNGLPAFGTCAGMILLASTIVDGRADQIALEILDITVRRNGYGRQVDSFETDIAVEGLDDPFHAVFIRAPIVERTGNGVEVMALDPQGNPALVRQGRILATSFHPELTADDRIHRMFVESVLATAERSL